MDEKFKESQNPEEAEYFKIIEEIQGEDYNFRRTTYFSDGQKKAAQTYKLKGEKTVYEGLHKHWYKWRAFLYGKLQKG